MANPEHVKWLKEGVEAWNKRRERKNGLIPGLVFSAKLQDADLRDAKLRGADLIQADLRGAHLSEADLRDADLRDADLRGAGLIRTDLRGANLYGANLRGANLLNANLSDTDLRYAILCGADLSYSEPWKAKLYGISTTNDETDSRHDSLTSRETHLLPCSMLANKTTYKTALTARMVACMSLRYRETWSNHLTVIVSALLLTFLKSGEASRICYWVRRCPTFLNLWILKMNSPLVTTPKSWTASTILSGMRNRPFRRKLIPETCSASL